MKEFPKWIYHEAEGSKIVANTGQLAKAIKKGWVDSPGKFKDALEKAKLEAEELLDEIEDVLDPPGPEAKIEEQKPE